MVSGFIFYYLKYYKGKYDSFIPFVKNKFRRLLIPYIVVCIVWIIPFQVFLQKINIKTVLVNIALGIYPNQLWFLLMLFLVFIIVWLLADFLKTHDGLGFLIVVSMHILGVLFSWFIPNYLQIWSALRHVLFFWMGFKICQKN